jgi:uncharacterized membrane protein
MQLLLFSIIGIYIFFLPGFFLSCLFYRWGKIDLIERGILSIALSLIGVTLIVSYSNLLGLPVNAISIMIQVTVLLFIEALIFLLQYKKNTI